MHKYHNNNNNGPRKICVVQFKNSIYFSFVKLEKKREKGSEMYFEFRTCDVMGISSQSMKF